MDTRLLATFEADRESVLADTSLEPGEKAIMATPEAYRLLLSMAGGDLLTPSVAPEPPVWLSVVGTGIRTLYRKLLPKHVLAENEPG